MPPKRKATGESAGTHGAKKPSSKPTSSKRKSFRDRLAEMDEDEIAAMMAEVEQIEAECIGSRHATPSTQHKQDAHLRAYRAFVRFAHQLEPNIPDSDVDAVVWPVDYEKLRNQLKYFLVFICLNVESGEPCITLSRYRDSMLFWVLRNTRDSGDPVLKKLHYAMTGAIRFLQKKSRALADPVRPIPLGNL